MSDVNPISDDALSLSGLLLEAYKEIRGALNSHTEWPAGYTNNSRRDRSLATAADHIEQARRLIRAGQTVAKKEHDAS